MKSCDRWNWNFVFYCELETVHRHCLISTARFVEFCLPYDGYFDRKLQMFCQSNWRSSSRHFDMCIQKKMTRHKVNKSEANPSSENVLRWSLRSQLRHINVWQTMALLTYSNQHRHLCDLVHLIEKFLLSFLDFNIKWCKEGLRVVSHSESFHRLSSTRGSQKD